MSCDRRLIHVCAASNRFIAMRKLRSVVLLLVAGCAGAPSAAESDAGRARFTDTNDDGLPDARASSAAAGSAEFVDRDDDGLPDRRVPAAADR